MYERKCPTCEFSAVCLTFNEIPKSVIGALGGCRVCKSIWIFRARRAPKHGVGAYTRYIRLYEFSVIMNCSKHKLYKQKLLGELDSCPACASSVTDELSLGWYGAGTRNGHSLAVSAQPDERGCYDVLEVNKKERDT